MHLTRQKKTRENTCLILLRGQTKKKNRKKDKQTELNAKPSLNVEGNQHLNNRYAVPRIHIVTLNRLRK